MDPLMDAQLASDLAALMATTDGSVPARIKSLIGQHGDGWEITAVNAGTQTEWVPDGPLVGQDRYQWSMDRLLGKAVTPAAVQVREDGYYLRVIGDAIALEAWLREHGWHKAFAGPPTPSGWGSDARAKCG